MRTKTTKHKLTPAEARAAFHRKHAGAAPDTGPMTPAQRAAAKRRLDRAAAAAAEQRAEDAARGEAAVKRAREKRDADLRATVLVRCRSATVARKVTSDDEERIVNTIQNADRRAAESGRAFDLYRAINTKLHELGYTALPPAPTDSRENRLAPGADRRDAATRAREMTERVRADRETYRETLRRFGLEDPSTGTRNPGGFGF